MRTTVTIDEDVERLLKENMHRKRKSFKQALNDALRIGLQSAHSKSSKKFAVQARPLNLLSGIDPAKLSNIDTEEEIEEYKRKSTALSKRL